jgi:hypothetical protein
MDQPSVSRALVDGARRSREACSQRQDEPAYLTLWRRRKWWIIGAGLLILEGILMGTLGGTIGRHF